MTMLPVPAEEITQQSFWEQALAFFSRVIDKLASVVDELRKQRSSKVGIFELSLPVANTEYVWQLPLGIKRFTMQCRDSTDVRVATQRDVVAASQSPYLTMKGGVAWDEADLDIKTLDVRLYFACSIAAKTVEFVIWS